MVAVTAAGVVFPSAGGAAKAVWTKAVVDNFVDEFPAATVFVVLLLPIALAAAVAVINVLAIAPLKQDDGTETELFKFQLARAVIISMLYMPETSQLVPVLVTVIIVADVPAVVALSDKLGTEADQPGNTSVSPVCGCTVHA